MEETEFKASLPKSALNLYVKLYCRERKLSEANVKNGHMALMEATKSWLSLNKSEKEVFITKYNNAVTENRKKIADALKNAKPYLKKRDLKRPKKNHFRSTNNNCGQYQEHPEGKHFDPRSFQTILEDSKPIINEINPDDKSGLSLTETQQIPVHANELHTNYYLATDHVSEPSPPRLKSGKELFEILRNKEENCISWDSLSTSEKRRYQNAILSIKRNYIKCYRSFLESLSPEKLFNYYLNKKKRRSELNN